MPAAGNLQVCNGASICQWLRVVTVNTGPRWGPVNKFRYISPQRQFTPLKLHPNIKSAWKWFHYIESGMKCPWGEVSLVWKFRRPSKICLELMQGPVPVRNKQMRVRSRVQYYSSAQIFSYHLKTLWIGKVSHSGSNFFIALNILAKLGNTKFFFHFFLRTNAIGWGIEQHSFFSFS